MDKLREQKEDRGHFAHHRLGTLIGQGGRDPGLATGVGCGGGEDEIVENQSFMGISKLGGRVTLGPRQSRW